MPGGKHETKLEPRTGNGGSTSKTPVSKDCATVWPNGAVMDRQTREMWGHGG